MANILMIETSAKACSVALSRDFQIEFSRETLEGPNHASVLGQYVEEVMKYARELRIGVSEAKGLAFGLNVPLIAVSTLKAMCCQVMFHTDIQMEEGELYCPMIDARRMEVYMALYDQALGEVKAPSAVVVDEQWLESLLADKVVYFFGDGADKCKDLLTKYPNARYVKDVRVMARDMLALSIQAFNRGKFADTAYFTPFYLKEFEASKPKDLLSSL